MKDRWVRGSGAFLGGGTTCICEKRELQITGAQYLGPWRDSLRVSVTELWDAAQVRSNGFWASFTVVSPCTLGEVDQNDIRAYRRLETRRGAIRYIVCQMAPPPCSSAGVVGCLRPLKLLRR